MVFADQPEENFGKIRYEVFDNVTHKPLSKGICAKVLRLSDFRISHASGTLYNKSIDLGDHFIVGLADDVNGNGSHFSRSIDGNLTDIDGYVVGKSSEMKDVYGGFGLYGGRNDVRTFSWDWFDVDRPDHATKLQEDGELFFENKRTSRGTEVKRIRFLTDVSVRIDRWGQKDPIEPAWRIKIFKGSEIKWPEVDRANLTPEH